MHLVRHMCDIRCVVTDTLKVTDRMQIQGYLTGLCRVHLTFGQLDQILAQTALVFVDQVFFSLYFIELVLLILSFSRFMALFTFLRSFFAIPFIAR